MANYTLRADGTAANKAAAVDGDPATVSECMSVSTHNSETFAAGDVIMLADDGGDYRATLTPPSAGSSGNPITYEAYSGDTPVLNGAEIIAGWTVYSGSVYQATAANQRQQLFIDGTFGDRKDSIVACVAEYDWYWASDTLYLYAPGDPDTEYTTVEASYRQLGMDIQADYITVDGLTAKYANRNGIGGYQAGDNVLVKNCLGEWNWYKGIGPEGLSLHTDWTIEDNVCRYNGVGGISLGSTFQDCIIRRNECYENAKFQPAGNSYDEEQWNWGFGIKVFGLDSNSHGVQIYENKSYANGRGEDQDQQGSGTGIWIDHVTGLSNSTSDVYHNLVYDNKGNGIFIEISSYARVWANVCYDNGASNMWGEPANITVDCRESFITDNNTVFNNTCVGGMYGIKVGTYYNQAGMSISDNTVKNNIVVDASVTNMWCYQGGDNTGYGSGNVYERNCFGAEDTDFLWWGGGSKQSTYDAWLAVSSQEDNNIESDPVFTAAGSDDYTIATGSGTIDAAEDLGAPYGTALMPTSSWPDAVVTGDQGDY